MRENVSYRKPIKLPSSLCVFDLIHLIRSTHLSAFRPLSGKEENTLRSKRQSLLSEVIFIQAATTSSSESSGGSPTEKNR